MTSQGIVSEMLEELRNLLKSETVFGEPMVVSDNVTLIPISKISFAFGAAGRDNKEKTNVTSGTGGGASVEPIAMIVVKNDDVKLLKLKEKNINIMDIVSVVSKFADKFKNMSEDKKKKENKEEDDN